MAKAEVDIHVLHVYRYTTGYDIQLKSDQTERLLNKPYVNEIHLTGQNLT